VAPFALRGAHSRRFSRAERRHHLRMIAAKPADHRERRNCNAAQGETGIARERRFEHADRIAGQPVIVGDRTIERDARLGRAGELEALLVLGHRLVLSRLS
jgi:hypothetical protein